MERKTLAVRILAAVSKLYHYRSVCCYTVRRQCTVMYATECMQEFLTNPWEDRIYIKVE